MAVRMPQNKENNLCGMHWLCFAKFLDIIIMFADILKRKELPVP